MTWIFLSWMFSQLFVANIGSTVETGEPENQAMDGGLGQPPRALDGGLGQPPRF